MPNPTGGVIRFRGQPLPYVRLRQLFALGGVAPARENIVVVEHDGHRAGLAVDALYGESQTVIRPLGKLFSRLRGISGAAILESGRVALILDVPMLFNEVFRQAMPDIASER